MSISLQTTSLADLHEISSLLKASYEALMPTCYSPEVLELALPAMTKAQEVLLTSGKFIKAVNQEGKIVGCGGWSFERPGSNEIIKGLGHIRHFATHPDFTKQGIGRQIYSWCEKQALQAGIREFECFSSLNGVDYYKAMGFEPKFEINIPMGGSQNFTALRMHKHL